TAATLTAATLATAAVGPGLAEVLDLLRVQARAGALGARQPALGPLGDVQVGEEVRAGGVGLHRLGDAQVERLVDHRPLGGVVPVDEGDGDAGVARATGTSDAVDVGLLVVGALVVD